FIIDIETKAREADEKCQDLMERINFMVSHVLVLERIEVIDTLKTVLQRVQDVLKEAASLIEAYRKQGKIARRLKMSNTQNFESMAGKISSCSSDLMMSLQIQQTGDLSVLKRSVPRDLAAETFIRDNGGQEAINSNPELVKQFADKMHLAMSDKVMEQMQSNMQELMTQNQHQIEDLIRQSSNTNVVDMIKALATQQREWEAERKLTCVQCEKEYFVSLNGPESCNYHSAVGNNNYYNCCQRSSPCRKGYHQPEHHSKYPYSSFFPWSYGLLGYSDTTNYWANIRDVDLDTDEIQIVRVGQLLRWKSGAFEITTPLMLVNVGEIHDSRRCFLEIFDIATLEAERTKAVQTGNTLIFKTKDDSETDSFSMAEWVLDQDTQQITGIKLTVKVTNSKTPTVCIVPLDPKALKMPSGKSVEYVSKANTEIFLPDKAYEFPETIFRGPHLSETRLREPRSFKTKTSSSNLPIVLIPAWEMVANNNTMTANPDVDRFVGTWRGLNKSHLSNQNQVVLLSAKAEYRLLGEEEYKPVKYFGLRNAKFPLSIPPMETVDIPFEFTVDKPEHVVKRRNVAINFAHLTIHRPLRARITFTDVEGETVSLIQEYVHSVKGVVQRKENDIGYFYIDDVDLSQRTICTFKMPEDPKKHVVDIRAGFMMTSRISELDLRKIVYNAEKTGVTQVDMKIGCNDLGLDYTCWALVDLSCRRVYGFKAMMKHGSMTPIKYSGCLGYVPCPLYGGEGLETRPIQYANEENNVLVTDHYDDPLVVEDDTFDDDVPTPAPVVAATTPLVEPPVPVVVGSPVSDASNTVSTPATEKIISEATTVSTKAAETAEAKPVIAVVTSPTTSNTVIDPTPISNATLDLLQAKIAALEARLEASERQDALLTKILELEKKLEASTNVKVASDAAAVSHTDRISVIENRLASMDQKLDSMNTSLILLDGNASRIAKSLEKIAAVLST
ncbi:hypothetical protein BGZ46_003698, partial [Entomortierella lignicola]